MRPAVPLLAFLLTLTGCASWQPNLVTATRTARDVACAVCQAATDPHDQAEGHAQALRELTAAIAAAAARVSPEEADAEVKKLEAAAAQQRRAFEQLGRLAGQR